MKEVPLDRISNFADFGPPRRTEPKQIPVETYRSLLQQAGDGFLVVSESENILDINAKACELLGYEMDRLLGRPLNEIVPPKLRSRKVELIERLEREQSCLLELPLLAGTMVLLEGESGVGKGLAARAIHARSPRGKCAFVEINCSSLSETLLESELFGYEKGAFTGATARKPGLFEVADGGTLFLDEISDMPLAVQPKLLIAIETGSFRRLGSTRDLHSNVRFVASSNRSLKDEVKNGRFRADLYYRLDVMSLEIPPLRTHKTEDIPVLVEHFLNMFTRSRGRAAVEMTEDVADLLVAYNWPGNLRELRNVLERAVILSRGAPIGPQHLPQEMVQEPAREPAKPAAPISSSLDANDLPSLEEIELDHIRLVLEATGHNHSRSARILGLHRTTLLDKIKKHNLEN